MGLNWTRRLLEACLPNSYARREKPWEPLKLLSNLPRDGADDVGPHSRVHWSDHTCNADTANIAPGPASQQSERETRRKHKEPKVGDSSQDVSSDVRSCNFYPDQKETTKKNKHSIHLLVMPATKTLSGLLLSSSGPGPYHRRTLKDTLMST